MRELLVRKLPRVEEHLDLELPDQWQVLAKYSPKEFVALWNDLDDFQIYFRDFIGFVLYALQGVREARVEEFADLERSIQRDFWKVSPSGELERDSIQREISEYINVITTCLGLAAGRPAEDWRTVRYRRPRTKSSEVDSDAEDDNTGDV